MQIPKPFLNFNFQEFVITRWEWCIDIVESFDVIVECSSGFKKHINAFDFIIVFYHICDLIACMVYYNYFFNDVLICGNRVIQFDLVRLEEDSIDVYTLYKLGTVIMN
jgi:hypothetical protein